MSLASVVQEYQDRAHPRVARGTMELWRAAEARWVVSWGHRAIESLTAADIDRYFKGLMGRGWVSSSLRREAGYLRRFFAWAQARGYVAADPTVTLPRFSARARRRRVALRGPEVEALLRACREPYEVEARAQGRGHARAGQRWRQTHHPPEWLYPLVLGALRTLLRVSDLLDLRWGEIDLEAGRLIRCQSKTGGEVEIPLAADFRTWLAAQGPRRPGDRVWPHLDRQRVWRAFKAAARRAGLGHCTFHDLRSSGATWLLEQGIPVHLVQAMGGWARPDVLLGIYAQLHRDRLEPVAEALAQFGS